MSFLFGMYFAIQRLMLQHMRLLADLTSSQATARPALFPYRVSPRCGYIICRQSVRSENETR